MTTRPGSTPTLSTSRGSDQRRSPTAAGSSSRRNAAAGSRCRPTAKFSTSRRSCARGRRPVATPDAPASLASGRCPARGRRRRRGAAAAARARSTARGRPRRDARSVRRASRRVLRRGAAPAARSPLPRSVSRSWRGALGAPDRRASAAPGLRRPGWWPAAPADPAWRGRGWRHRWLPRPRAPPPPARRPTPGNS